MSNFEQTKRIYILGINPELPPGFKTPWGTWEDIHRIVNEDLAHAGRNGFPNTLQVVDSKKLDDSMALFEKQLTEHRDNGLEGLMFGAGIRNHKDPIPFERALGVAMRVLAGRVVMGGDGEMSGVKIMLNDGPDRHCWAIERAFGVKMEVE